MFRTTTLPTFVKTKGPKRRPWDTSHPSLTMHPGGYIQVSFVGWNNSYNYETTQVSHVFSAIYRGGHHLYRLGVEGICFGTCAAQRSPKKPCSGKVSCESLIVCCTTPANGVMSLEKIGETSIYLAKWFIIVHQPRFPWKKGNSLSKPPFGVGEPCEVAMKFDQIQDHSGQRGRFQNLVKVEHF